MEEAATACFLCFLEKIADELHVKERERENGMEGDEAGQDVTRRQRLPSVPSRRLALLSCVLTF